MLDFLAVGDLMLDVRLSAGAERHAPIASLAAGSAVNAARAAAALGARAGVAGAVGDDAIGHAVELEIASELETFLVRLDGSSTGTAVYGERVVVDRGANAHYMPTALPEARVTLVSGYLAEPAVVRALELASGLTAVDLQGATTCAPGADAVLGPSLDLDVLAPHHRVVVSTLGPEGAVAVADGERVEVRPRTIMAQTPIGAGDAFAAGFLLALVDGLALEECLRRGCASAEKA